MEVLHTKPASETLDDLRQRKAFTVFTIFINQNYLSTTICSVTDLKINLSIAYSLHDEKHSPGVQ